MGILINGRFNRYPHILKERAKKEDQLFYYEGEFVTSDFYNYITKGDNQIIQYSLESSKIERNISIVNFFDKENVI